MIMIIPFQLDLFKLIATSFLLVVGIRVAFAFPGSWFSKKNIIFSGASLWIVLVSSVGIPKSFISQ